MSTRNFVFIRQFARVSLIALVTVVLFKALSPLILPSSAADQIATVPAKDFPEPDLLAANVKGQQTAVFAGGCFWGMEAVFENLRGVTDVVTGYAGGEGKNANYEAVSAGQTDHAEAIKITYDPAQISYGQLLKIFFSVAHNPTELNRQGPDIGTQYRSAIFYTDRQQQQIADAYIKKLNQAKVFPKAIATQLNPLSQFYAAEDYHQNYIVRNPANPYVIIHDLPKLTHLQQQFPALYKQ
jgi:peptide-methionine (S)-S-oxide reductase